MGIQPLPTANALELDAAVRAELERLSQSFPPGLQYRIAFENTSVVRESIREVLKTLAEAVGLVSSTMRPGIVARAEFEVAYPNR